MSDNNIVNPNAEQQENAPVAETTAPEATTATTNEPVEEKSVEAAQPVAETVAEEAQPQAPVKAEEPVAETVAAHDDFDWSIDKRNVSHYAAEEKIKYDKV